MNIEKPENSGESSSWLKRQARKIAAVGAFSLASAAPLVGRSQEVSASDTAVVPGKEWRYNNNRVEATSPSKKYPGFLESYNQNLHLGSDSSTYTFTGYEDENGERIRVPDSIQIDLLSAEAKLAAEEAPDVWAKKRLEFQKTDAFKAEVKENQIQWYKDKIHEIDFLAGEYDSSLPMTKEQWDEFQAGNMKMKDGLQRFLDGILAGKEEEYLAKTCEQNTKNYAELVKEAEERIQLLNEDIKRLREEKEHVAKYILNHTKKSELKK